MKKIIDVLGLGPLEIDFDLPEDAVQCYGFGKGELNVQYESKRFGELNPMHGRKHNEKTKSIIKKKRAHQVFPDNFSEIMSEAVKKSYDEGRKPGYGKAGMHSEDGKKRIAEATKSKNPMMDEKARLKVSKFMTKRMLSDNPMSSAESRAKVGASKLGRKKFLIHGEYKMLRVNPPDIEL